MPKVFLSPSNQFANRYAAGNTNEGKQMGLAANLLKIALERCGVSVLLMHDQSMSEKCKTANNWGADLYLPIHSNACNGQVGGTRLFCWSKPGKGYDACQAIFSFLAPITPGDSENIKVDDTLYEVRYPYAPVAYIETEFHDVPAYAEWIISHTADIAEAICKGVCKYFGIPYVAPSKAQTCTITLPVLSTGSEGASVTALQRLLNGNGAKLAVDGDFGSKTASAVRTFQKKVAIDIDGVVGKDTWGALLT